MSAILKDLFVGDTIAYLKRACLRRKIVWVGFDSGARFSKNDAGGAMLYVKNLDEKNCLKVAG